MQKLWSSKSKRSQPLPPEDEDTSSPETEILEPEETTTTTSAEDRLKYFSKLLKTPWQRQVSWSWLFLLCGVGGVVLTTIFGLQYLTAPEATPDSNLACKSKISGEWQTPFGKLTLREESENLVSGKYEYANFERGKITGELTGRLSNNVITFDWTETPKQQPKQQGKGILVFGEGCKEFYGSYGTGESTNNFGNWQGLRFTK
ncbi:hypothetical protein [Phormidium tenue]|jgi:hypothetical protein|uniref:DUF1579 domain-containing protein n=1 Tax=Phormidium tenue FACHB-1050 TaxID=2692857 RepID=A0ABR8CH31_9CYAN|nr:hypothetical protein [Phormidium tenue]MBD2319618.1 hypothetical protein [Phormidium tenue FACHB-1050]